MDELSLLPEHVDELLGGDLALSSTLHEIEVRPRAGAVRGVVQESLWDRLTHQLVLSRSQSSSSHGQQLTWPQSLTPPLRRA